jgi:hypothetical protein
MKPRFNKDNVLTHIELRRKELEDYWGFTHNDGWNQVKDSPIERIVAYGEYSGLEGLSDDIFYNSLKIN